MRAATGEAKRDCRNDCANMYGGAVDDDTDDNLAAAVVVSASHTMVELDWAMVH